jgi:hypothetical protein
MAGIAGSTTDEMLAWRATSVGNVLVDATASRGASLSEDDATSATATSDTAFAPGDGVRSGLPTSETCWETAACAGKRTRPPDITVATTLRCAGGSPPPAALPAPSSSPPRSRGAALDGDAVFSTSASSRSRYFLAASPAASAAAARCEMETVYL